ncbi:MAG TPA: hypothetical protein PLE82_06015 [Saccharofermentans sp.]|nr:hypothetical protein [Saccharofermentans sp.]
MADATKATEAEKPAFNVADTDKRNDKRVLVDYVFANRYAPELVSIFDDYAAELDAALETEGLLAVTTPVDTLIEQLSEAINKRYVSFEDEDGVEQPGVYADYQLRGNAASFFLPKTARVVKTVTEKAEDILAKASPEQLAALAAALKERGLEL